MIRVTVELVPHGDESRKETIATGLIANDGNGTPRYGSYYGLWTVNDWGVWRQMTFRTEGFHRKASVLALIKHCLDEDYTKFGPCEEITPDPKDPAACEETLRAEADSAEADLEEKGVLAEAIHAPEEDPWARTLLRAMQIGDRDREQRELASSLRAQNASNLVVRDPGLRPLP